MNTVRVNAIAAAGRVLRYPDTGYAADLRAFAALCRSLDCPSAALEDFAERAASATPESLQELFTQTFDFTPDCALEVGWHLFGEDYERGAFMTRVRQQLRSHEIQEGSELPDHLASLLQLIASAPDDTGALVDDALLPAVGKICTGLERNASPFHPVLNALSALLAADGASRTESSHV